MIESGSLNKILLMGSAGAGKTTILSILFPKKSHYNISIISKQQKLVIFDYLSVCVWDCGGYYGLMNDSIYCNQQKLFKNTKLLIFVVDVQQEQLNLNRSIQYCKISINKMQLYNQNGQIFILIHKMDKIPVDKQQKVFQQTKYKIINTLFVASEPTKKVKQFFATSIWNQSLYQAWCYIVQSVAPNIKQLNLALQQISQNCLCQQAVLFQTHTYLVVSHYNKNNQDSIAKYQRISNLIKFFRITCKKYAKHIEEICIKTNKFNILLMQFTKNLHILLVYKDKQSKTAIKMNVLNMKNVLKFQNQNQTEEQIVI